MMFLMSCRTTRPDTPYEDWVATLKVDPVFKKMLRARHAAFMALLQTDAELTEIVYDDTNPNFVYWQESLRHLISDDILERMEQNDIVEVDRKFEGQLRRWSDQATPRVQRAAADFCQLRIREKTIAWRTVPRHSSSGVDVETQWISLSHFLAVKDYDSEKEEAA